MNGTEKGTRKDAKAFYVICLSVKDSQLVPIQGYATSKDSWKELSNLYENKGAEKKIHLQ